MLKQLNKPKERPLDDVAHELVLAMNTAHRCRAFMQQISDTRNWLVQFNDGRIPTILVAEHWQNEPNRYMYNVCRHQKYIEMHRERGYWFYYYPFNETGELILEYKKYKSMIYSKNEKEYWNELRVLKILDKMMINDPELYDRIQKTPQFYFHFSMLVKLAKFSKL
jgi:hypothetical protein